MFRHTILITYRNFLRYKSSFFINLVGLSSGLACTLLIYLWVADELSADRFHQKADRLYQVLRNVQRPDGIRTGESTPARLGESLLAEMPEVEYAVSVNSSGEYSGEGIIVYEDKHLKAKGIFASEDYFNVFSYDLIQGNKDRVLADKNGVLISETLAKKVFNTTDNIVGKTFVWNHRVRFEGPLYVSGIFKDVPANSTCQFDIVFNFKKLLEGDRNAEQWNAGPAETYLVLKDGTSIVEFNKKISRHLFSKVPDNKATLFVSRYSDKYLHGRFESGVQSGGRIEYVWLFSMIAVFILAIACINFMNLSTAQASRKMKEVGIKKTMGVNRKVLIFQFLGESILMAFLSLAIATLLVFVLLPQFNELTNKQLHFTPGIKPFLVIGGMVLFTGIVSGGYPAFYLSGFEPARVLKGKLATTFGDVWIRKGLVVTQFVLSIVFMVAFLIVNRQIEFTQTKSLGYEKENVLMFSRQGRISWDAHETFMSALRDIPGVVNASCMFGSILEKDLSLHGGFSWEGQPPGAKEILFPSPTVSHDFIETLNIRIKEGRTFSDAYGEESKIVVNEAAVKMMGFPDPIGRMIRDGQHEKQIVGVVKDFQYGSLHHQISPVFFRYSSRGSDVMVKVQPGSEANTIERLGEVYEKFHPGYPFEFTFLDADYQRLYDSEKRVAVLSKYFAVIAIIISCLGLFGLAAFTAQKRQKEIGIRKILGATQAGIVSLLSADFTKMILIAIAIALPVSYFTALKWLERFAYRIALEWWFFAGAGVAALVIAWITIGMQTIRAAHTNPADYIRTE
ncbi:ABC transporter permease [Chryseolinea lacunae]|uniref:ABC transporter permease n=1 Tax=Chryseolinea lacunae TaxID=2801331 RepID=A0ABS1L294_9BACT|nr:ABC transporter permease [Chryseolinea lacunae]MBL0744666.1 ABC transporter permease [Chryseolinea lacunae]